MKEKLKDDRFAKSLLFKFISVLLFAVVALLLLNILTQSKDGRRQIVDEDGATEYVNVDTVATREEIRLAEVLQTIKGVGEVHVMITYKDRQVTTSMFTNETTRDERAVKGVIITATGGASPIVKKNIINAVTAVFDIPIQNVMVYEKNEEDF